jgi:hypothetical protein
MSVLHRITLPPKQQWRSDYGPIASDLGEWQSCDGESHEFCDPMVSRTVSIDDDHTLHLFCEAHRVDAAVERLRQLLGG